MVEADHREAGCAGLAPGRKRSLALQPLVVVSPPEDLGCYGWLVERCAGVALSRTPFRPSCPIRKATAIGVKRGPSSQPGSILANFDVLEFDVHVLAAVKLQGDVAFGASGVVD